VDTSTIQDWGDAFMASMTSALMVFMTALPKVIGFIIILAVGWFVASLIAKGVAAVLHAVRFNDLGQRSGFSDFIGKMGMDTDASNFIAMIAKWFVRLITLVVAFDALGLPAVSDVLRQLLLWLPNLVVALVVLVVGGIAARALSNLVRGASAKGGLGNPNLLARIAQTAVWAFAIVVAVNQVGIGTELVNTLFMAVVGAVALAVGLAFGLGGKDTAGMMVHDWYVKGRGAAPRIAEAAEAAAEQPNPVDYSRPIRQ
jgi:hypothetical protein